MTELESGGPFVEDSFIFEPRENVIGGEVIRHDCVASAPCEEPCEADFTLAEWGACLDGFYYTVNEVVVVPSTLRGFSTVDFADIVVRWDSGQETTFIGHFIKQDGVSETDRFQGLFYIREEEFEPAPVEEEEPCEEEPCEPAPVVVEPLLSIYEGPITRLSESASPGPVSIASPETWNIMWIMGCPVHIHPDLILDGPTVDDEPIRGASLFELLDEDDDRGHALSIIGATGKGVAERVGQIYVMQEIVVELAENVIIYPDASAAAAEFDGTSNVLKLFPVVGSPTLPVAPQPVAGSPQSFQMKVKLSEDRNFPGSWLDAGGEALDDQTRRGSSGCAHERPRLVPRTRRILFHLRRRRRHRRDFLRRRGRDHRPARYPSRRADQPLQPPLRYQRRRGAHGNQGPVRIRRAHPARHGGQPRDEIRYGKRRRCFPVPRARRFRLFGPVRVGHRPDRHARQDLLRR
jgi:hypothetical protein